MATRRKTIELDADLYAVPRRWLFNFRKGEVEYEAYDDGEQKLEFKVFGLKAPGEGILSLATSQGTICQVEVQGGRGHIYLNTRDGHPLPELEPGETVEVYYQGKVLLEGKLKRDG